MWNVTNLSFLRPDMNNTKVEAQLAFNSTTGTADTPTIEEITELLMEELREANTDSNLNIDISSIQVMGE